MFLNGVQVGDVSRISLNFATFSALTVGCQGVYPAVGEQKTGDPPVLSKFLVGNIAQILVCSAFSDAQRNAVQNFSALREMAI